MMYNTITLFFFSTHFSYYVCCLEFYSIILLDHTFVTGNLSSLFGLTIQPHCRFQSQKIVGE
jgi:hypothetical protein